MRVSSRQVVAGAVLGITVAGLGGPAGPAVAQPSPTEVLRLCGTVHADANPGSDGLTAGFASGSGPGCPDDLWAFHGSGAGWTTTRTPYRGRVVASARDDVTSYVLYQAADGLRLGVWWGHDAFAPSRLLSPVRTEVTGDVAASGGGWWAVWSEPTGAFDTDELYQAKTYGGEVARQRVTSNALPDREPSLTLQPAAGAVLAWVRNDAPAAPDSSDIWIGTSTGGAWSTRAVFTAGTFNSQPDLLSWGPTHVGFVRDGAPVYADNALGRYSVRGFPRPEGGEAVDPEVGAAGGMEYLAWVEVGDEFEPVVLAVGDPAGTWRREVVSGVGPAGSGTQQVHAVVGGVTEATVVWSAAGTLWAATVPAADGCVRGSIAQHWAALGGASGFLGEPLTCEQPTPYRPGAYTHFQGGSIYWSPTTGAHEVHGSIRDTWARLGWENSAVGFPVTDELPTPHRPGRYNHFEGGSVYWSPTTPASEVRGSIRALWAAMGWEESVLGFPVTDELRTPQRAGAFTHFERGSIYWSPETGAHAVWGAIRDAWAELGWEESPLGFPTSSEYAIPGGRRTDFEGGWVTWTPAGGAVVTATR